MRILLEYLPGSGGELVVDVVRSRNSKIYHAGSMADVMRFKSLPEAERKQFSLIHGRLASRLIDHVGSRVTRAYLAAHPATRFARYLAECAENRKSFLHPVATKLPPWKIAEKFVDFQNLLAKTFDPDLYDIIATQPKALLRSLGFGSKTVVDSSIVEDEKVDAANHADVQIYRWIVERSSGSGVYLRNRKWHASEVAVVTTHFNHCGSSRLRETYSQWLPTIGHPVTCCEAVPAGQSPEIDGSLSVTAGPENEVWQKERLINLAIENLPVPVRYVAWVDHDLVFGNPNWLTDAVEKLRRGYDALQLFSSITYLDRDGNRTQSGFSSSAMPNHQNSNPGGAWIAKRKFFDSIGGLYDRAIVGGGDAIWFAGMTGKRRDFELRHSEPFQRHIHRWYSKTANANVGHLPGEVFHLWHGDRENRQYISRDETMAGLGFDPERHVEVDQSGLMAWTSDAPPEMRLAVKQYFEDRRDDG